VSVGGDQNGALPPPGKKEKKTGLRKRPASNPPRALRKKGGNRPSPNRSFDQFYLLPSFLPPAGEKEKKDGDFPVTSCSPPPAPLKQAQPLPEKEERAASSPLPPPHKRGKKEKGPRSASFFICNPSRPGSFPFRKGKKKKGKNPAFPPGVGSRLTPLKEDLTALPLPTKKKPARGRNVSPTCPAPVREKKKTKQTEGGGKKERKGKGEKRASGDRVWKLCGVGLSCCRGKKERNRRAGGVTAAQPSWVADKGGRKKRARVGRPETCRNSPLSPMGREKKARRLYLVAVARPPGSLELPGGKEKKDRLFSGSVLAGLPPRERKDFVAASEASAGPPGSLSLCQPKGEGKKKGKGLAGRRTFQVALPTLPFWRAPKEKEGNLAKTS